MTSSLKMSVKELTNQIYVNERHVDDFDQYSESSCLILRECSNLPDKKTSNLDFENFAWETLNSKLQLSDLVRNSDLNVSHLLHHENLKTQLL